MENESLVVVELVPNARGALSKKGTYYRFEAIEPSDGTKPAVPGLYLGTWAVEGADPQRIKLTVEILS